MGPRRRAPSAWTVLTVRPVEVVDRMPLRPPDSDSWTSTGLPVTAPFLTTQFRIPKPPVPPQRSAIPWIMVFVPAMFGIVMATVFHSPFYLLFAAMTPIMVIGQTVTARRTGKKSHRKQTAEHRERVSALERAIDAAVLAERDERRSSSSDAGSLRVVATTPGRRLWERRPSTPTTCTSGSASVTCPRRSPCRTTTTSTASRTRTGSPGASQ
ncbi:hypothetical protein QP157_20895 [Sphingomonas sp. LR61]|uniref:hypothetical protein n=1 Tax=Sphingomonas sp. LR61 TaxID=3050234 RepID=UPI002FE3D4FA